MRPRVPCARANHEEARVEGSPLPHRVRRVPHRAARRRPDRRRRARPGEQGFVPTRAAWAELAAADGPRTALAAVTLAHPVVPRKLICIGLNYRDHAEESELDLPEVPVIFAKWTTSLIGHGETIVIPREETRPDYEGELAVVIGERGLPRDGRRCARGRRRLHLLPRRLGAPRPARDAAAPVHLRQELRHVRPARARGSSMPTASTSERWTSRRSSRARRCSARTRRT